MRRVRSEEVHRLLGVSTDEKWKAVAADLIDSREEIERLGDCLDERDQTLLHMGHEIGLHDGESYVDGASRVGDRMRDLEAAVLRARELLEQGEAQAALAAIKLIEPPPAKVPSECPDCHAVWDQAADMHNPEGLREWWEAGNHVCWRGRKA